MHRLCLEFFRLPRPKMEWRQRCLLQCSEALMDLAQAPVFLLIPSGVRTGDHSAKARGGCLFLFLSTHEDAIPLLKFPLFQVRSVASLQVGSIQTGSFSDCGQCFTVAWMPTKPHQHLAVGFYDGEKEQNCVEGGFLFTGLASYMLSSLPRHCGTVEPPQQVPTAASTPARWLPQALPIPLLSSP